MTSPRAMPVLAVSACVFAPDGRVLLVQRGRPPGVGLWSVPGGKLELGETLTEAVVREVREETGLAVTVGALTDVLERRLDGHGQVTTTPANLAYHYVILTYLGWANGTPTAGSDARAARWVHLDDARALPTTDGLIDVLLRAAAVAGLAPSGQP